MRPLDPEPPDLQPTCCAICRAEGNAATVYEANFQPSDLTPEAFSARRTPDRVHYRLVRCRECGLLRSDPVLSAAATAALYAQSAFTYGAETENLQRTYGAYLQRLQRYGAGKGALLEIGCGNGFFLEEALRQGYSSVAGVEPSREAVSQATGHMRPHLKAGFFKPGLYEPEQFDVICMFQVLDHLRDPAETLRECRRLIKPGGLVLAIQHNAAALSARLLGERSPIIDIEHTYLYTPRTLGRLFLKCEFGVREAGASWNRYSLDYLVGLLPLPAPAKRFAAGALRMMHLGRLPVRALLGNFFLVASVNPRQFSCRTVKCLSPSGLSSRRTRVSPMSG